jgi:cellulose synthase (UDP-forming)
VALRPIDSKLSDRAYLGVGVMTLVACLMMTGYISLRVAMVVGGTGYSLADGVMALLLLAAELFITMHAIGYFANLLKCQRRQKTIDPLVFVKHTTAPVAVLVAAFNELEHVLEGTLSAARAMDYPNASFYVLDDSTKPECVEGARRVAEKYGARLVHRTNRAGYKAGAINDLIPHLTETYVALLDADRSRSRAG